MRDTAEEKEASDLVMRLLLIAYVSKNQGHNFKFTQNLGIRKSVFKKKLLINN